MNRTSKATEFRDIFQNSLKINARSMSVKTLLSDRNLKRINYSPYYQRNYVWDNTKQTFFIESVILGTEIPPLILFKNGAKIEVIDGRQRFETLKLFKENDFTLNISGLKKLQILAKKSFNKLSNQIQDIFLNSNIRVFEFEVINHPNLSEQTIDSTKKEIFRRYNTGITPLTREELDNAKYDEDEFSELFKKELRSNNDFFINFNRCFFPVELSKDSTNVNTNSDGIIAKNVDFIRRFRILNSFPISTYAGSDRTEIIDLLYEFAKDNSENPEKDFIDFKYILEIVFGIYKDLCQLPGLSNKLIYQCILWSITILKKENISFTYDKEIFKEHFLKNINNYSEDNNHYYRNIIDRYSDTANFFQKLTNFDFAIFIKDEGFRAKIGKLKQTEVDAAKSIEELSSLRTHKPNPISIPIDEIRNDLQTTRYLVRPSYQRQEKINEIKASSIIESILLGINLPPIFIYKRDKNTKTDVIKEVVDGQQRLLAVIGFLGEQFYNEDGKLTYSKNNNFKLKGLKILTDLEGKNFSGLSSTLQDKILDFVLDLIIIEESVNEEFDEVDLFIRLNYKPYPIKSNSFEMWNSIVDYEVIKSIKKVTESHKKWFFLRERIEGKPDRMENEEMITILSYICYYNIMNQTEEIIGFFLRQDRITCRLNNKKGLGDFLVNLDNLATDKVKFLEAIDRTDHLINNLSKLFDDSPTKESFNEQLNVKLSKTFRRSLQDFYVIWLVIDQIPDKTFDTDKNEILSDIKQLLSILKNSNDTEVNESYFNQFKMILSTAKSRC